MRQKILTPLGTELTFHDDPVVSAEPFNESINTLLALISTESVRRKTTILELMSEIDCACNALTDSICVSGNDAATNLRWVRRLRAVLAKVSP